MSLIKCKECGNELSSEATACPHCGKPNNAAKPTTPAAKGCLVFIVVIAVLAIMSYCGNHEDSKPETKPATSSPTDTPASASKAADDTAILNDADALDKKYGVEAMLTCASDADDYLRSISKYSFKWDDLGFADFKFDRYRKVISSPGVLTAISNKVSLQNGFGAFERIELYCDYDTQSKKTVEYSINSPRYHPMALPPSSDETVPPASPSTQNVTPRSLPSNSEQTLATTTVPASAAAEVATSSTPATTPDDLTPVRAIDAQAADHIANFCRQNGGDTQREMLCRAQEMAAWRRLVPGHEFPNMTQAIIDRCKQPPFPDTFVAREACAKYELNAGIQQ